METPAEVRPKRKYTKRKTHTANNSSETGIQLHTIQLQIDPDCIEQLKKQQVAEREKEFRQGVLAKFESHIAELKEDIQETGDVPESLELPTTVGTASADFSSKVTPDRVLVPGNDYAVRVHVGLMSLMGWATREIVGLQKQIVGLKSNSTNHQSPEAGVEVQSVVTPACPPVTPPAGTEEFFSA